MELIAKVYATTDKKKLKAGSKIYDYGAINLRSPALLKFVGKKVKVIVKSI